MVRPVDLTNFDPRPPSPPTTNGPTAKEEYRAGEYIFHQGDPGDRAYLVHSGAVEIQRNRDGFSRTICTIGERGLFGEMALVDGKPRSAAAMAKTDVVLIVIKRDRFTAKMEYCDSFLRSMIRILARNLRATNSLLDESVVRSVPGSDSMLADIEELTRE